MHYRRLALAIGCLWGWIGVGVGCSRGASASGDSSSRIHHSHTNVVLLTLCTLRADHLGCYGYSRDTSPNIDRMAREGVLFEHTLTQTPWTRASVAAMVTGLYPRTLNIGEPKKKTEPRLLHGDFTTLAEHLQPLGYYTIGITANAMLNDEFNFTQGYDFYQGTGANWKKTKRKGVPRGADLNELLFEQLGGLAKGRRFFAHLVNTDVHEHDPHDEVYETETPAPFEVGTPVSNLDKYDLLLRYADEQVGALRRGLESLGLSDTLIIINADHGEGFKEGRENDNGHGGRLYNSTLWVPWIVHHPALPAPGRRYPGLVQIVDLVPTVLELLGAPMDSSKFDGASRWNAVAGDGAATGAAFGFTETQFKHADKRAILDGAWKLIADYDPGVEKKRPLKEPLYELYRYREDRLELDNRVKKQSDVFQDLSRRLAEWQSSHPPAVNDEGLVARIHPETAKRLKDFGYVDEDGEEDETDDGTVSPDSNEETSD